MSFISSEPLRSLLHYQPPRLVQLFISRVSTLSPKDFDLPATTAHLLIALASRIDKSDAAAEITVSQERIAHDIGRTRRTVYKHLSLLEEAGYIQRAMQRKIGKTGWSVRAISFTPEFFQHVISLTAEKAKKANAMWEVFSHNPLSPSGNIKKEIIGTNSDNATQKTRHGLFVKAIDGIDMQSVLDALNSMSKRQALAILGKASAAKVNIQQAIAYMQSLKTKVKSWYSYLTKALEKPVDYGAVMQQKAKRTEENQDFAFVKAWLLNHQGKKVKLLKDLFVVDQSALVNNQGALVINEKNAVAFARRIREGKLSVLDTPPPQPTTPPQQAAPLPVSKETTQTQLPQKKADPVPVIGSGKGMSAAKQAIEAARQILKKRALT